MATYIKPEAIKDSSLPIEKIDNVALELADKVNALDDNGKNTFLNKIGLGKIGVISQKQNWTSDFSSYTISNVVKGIIPQSNIDLYVMGGAVFNEETGYFELNELVDISYKEMIDIYNFTKVSGGTYANNQYNMNKARTNMPKSEYPSHLGDNAWALLSGSNFETVQFNREAYHRFTNCKFFCYVCRRLKKILGIITFDGSIAGFDDAQNLEYLRIIKLNQSINIRKSSKLSNESIIYMINNETATSAITITLHADAYARAMANAEILAALETHTNISLASA